MRTNTNTTRQPPLHNQNNTNKTKDPPSTKQRGALRSLMSKARSVDSVVLKQPNHQKNPSTSSSSTSSVYQHQHQHALQHPSASSQQAADDFLPNPKIQLPPSSPTSSTPPKKIWEGAYRNFLSLGKSGSSPDSDLSKSPTGVTGTTATTTTGASKKSSFSLVPGTKRLVTRAPLTPQILPSQQAHHHGLMVSAAALPMMPNMKGAYRSRTASLPDLDQRVRLETGGEPFMGPRPSYPPPPPSSFAQPRGGGGGGGHHHGGGNKKFLKSVFGRSTSDSHALDYVHRRTKSSNTVDELDAVMRKGVEKAISSSSNSNSPELRHHHHYQPHPCAHGLGHAPLYHASQQQQHLQQQHQQQYYNHRKHSSMPEVTVMQEIHDDDNDNEESSCLDSLLAASSASSPHMYQTGNGPSSFHAMMTTMMIPSPTNNNAEHELHSSSSSQMHQPGLSLEDELTGVAGEGASDSAYAHHDFLRPRQPQQQQQQQRGNLGQLLSSSQQQQQHQHQEEESHDELDTQHHYDRLKQTFPTASFSSSPGGVGEGYYSQQQTQQYHLNSSSTLAATLALETMLQDPSFTVNSSPSSIVYQRHQHHHQQYQQQQQQQYQPNSNTVPPDPEMKKVFTNFHNQARFARDATSPFLGDDSPSSLRHDSYVSYHLMMMRGAGTSVPHQYYSERGSQPLVNVSTSLPLEPVDEHSISIHKSMRLLKPIEGTESWQQGRRYLIAPAALASCPLSVLNKLSGATVRTATEAATSSMRLAGPNCSQNSTNVTTTHENDGGIGGGAAFGTIDLGECLITYVGEKHHLSLGKWSSCRLVLRQNYLLEYDCDSPITGLPRGFAHLQFATAYVHDDFQDSFELSFYASPCAKADHRVLMVRVKNREERDHWITCLNDAARLDIEDLWEFDPDIQFGCGRYAGVYPARRKPSKYLPRNNDSSGTTPIGEGDPDRSALLERCNCALKIVDKNEFWLRVAKGRERSDTLVRELAVQSTLTAKCGRVATFLQVRGFFETSDNVVMELELLEGTDLFDYVSKKGVLAEDEAAFILRDVLQSLDAMNRVGLAHRDIKPANVLMCNRKRDGVSVKVGDFGMSTFVGVDGLVRGRCGTPGYVAPEILTVGSRVGYGNKVDVFSAGVTLYVMLCGYEPFYGESEKELIEANKRGIIEFAESDWGDISKEARDLVMKMTAADPRDRISAKDALQHPWFGRLDCCIKKDSSIFAINGIPVQPNTSLTTSSSCETPEEGACVIS